MTGAEESSTWWKQLRALPRERRLGWRLLVATVLASTCLALFATAMLLYADYRRDIRAIDVELARMERSLLPSLANSLWSFDETQLKLQLDGLLQLQDVRHVALQARGGERFAAGTPPAGEALVRTFALRHAADANPLGQLHVAVSLDGVYARLLERAFEILAATAAGTLLIALIIHALVGRWVTRHLEQMARHARGLNLEQLGEPLVLQRRPGDRPDELDEVATALNDMTRALSEELARRAAINADRARLFDAYERNRALLQAIFDHSAAVITVKALDGRYLLVNRRVAERHHRPMEDFIGKTDHELFPRSVAEALRHFDQRVIEARAPLQAEEVMPLDDGPHTVLSSKAPLFNDKGELYAVCGIHTDITDRKRTEEELRLYRDQLEVRVAQRTAELQQAQTQLVQSEKMASIGVLAAGVAHEINNPLGFVSANLGTLSSYAGDLLALIAAYEAADGTIGAFAPQQLEAIRRCKERIGLGELREDLPHLSQETGEGLARVKKIVQDLKDFAHAGDSEWQLSDLHKGIDSTLNIAWNELKYKVEVSKHYGELPEIECLPSELNQVFMNLFVNAAQAIAGRGLIRITTGVEDGGVWAEVADTGAGIAPEHLQRIFEPFFTTKPVGHGTGLGLALSYSIVRKHHGRLEVQSRVGEGTTFRVWLPARQAMAQAA